MRKLTGLVIWLGISLCSQPLSADPGVVELLSTKGVIRLDTARSESEIQYRLEVETGKSTSLETSYTVKRVSVGNPDVLDVVVLGSRAIQLVSKKVGATNVLLWDSNGKPQAVIAVEVGAEYSQVESALRRTFGNPSIDVWGTGNAVVLRGSVASVVELDQVLSLTQVLLGDDEDAPELVNLLRVGGNHQVMLKVVIAEMSRTLGREFGMNVNALIQTGRGDTIGLSFNDASSAISSAELASNAARLFGSFSSLGALELLEVLLDLLEERGLSKILAKPTLVARSGETASFLVGGEVAIPVAQGGAFGSITIEYKNFGIALEFTPTVLGPNRIHLRVRPEVSRVDPTFGTEVDGTVIPGFVSRRAATSVELADGQSFMIAGLLSDEVRELQGKYPVLGNIPILGTLFSSREFYKKETELVIIVTPVLVKPLGPDLPDLPTDNFIDPDDFEFYFLGLMEARPSPDGGESSDQEGRPSPDAGESSDASESQGIVGKTGHIISTSFDGDNQ